MFHYLYKRAIYLNKINKITDFISSCIQKFHSFLNVKTGVFYVHQLLVKVVFKHLLYIMIQSWENFSRNSVACALQVGTGNFVLMF